MIAPLVISLTWTTPCAGGPVIAAAEAALTVVARDTPPARVLGLYRRFRCGVARRVAERFPHKSHDLTFLRRRALAECSPRRLSRGARADDAFEDFLGETPPRRFYADVRPALERLRAKYRCLRSARQCRSRALAVSPTCSTARSLHLRGCGQPDGEYSRICCARRRAGHRILHVGDDPLADVVGATQAGMQPYGSIETHRTWPAAVAPPARTITTLADILCTSLRRHSLAAYTRDC